MRPNKLKRNLIIIFSVMFIIAVAIFVLYNVTDIFRTKRGVFFRYFGQIPEMVNILETSTEYDNYKKTKGSMPYTTNGEMIITDSNNIADDSILNKVKLIVNGKTDVSKEKSNTDIYIKSDNSELFNMTISRDKNLYGFYAPQIADGYIVVRNSNLNELAKNMELPIVNNVPNQIMPINIDKILNTSIAEKKHIQKYIKMVRDKAPDTAYSKEQGVKIEIDGQKYATNAATLKLNEEQNSNLQISLLEELTKDSIMMNYITSKCKLMNLTGDCTDINSLNNRMKERIEQLNNEPEKAGELKITVYEYKQKNIQTEIQIENTIIKITHLTIDGKESVKIQIEDDDSKTITLKFVKSESDYSIKIQKEENEIINSVEFVYSITGTVEENNIQNHLTVNVIDDIKRITFNYNDNIKFTNDIGSFKEMQDGKVAVINDYDSGYIKEFVDLVKKQINSVYVSKAASIGINLDPIFEM